MGVVGNVESPHITNDNPISVNSFSKVGTPVVVTDIEESDINSSLGGGRILPGSFEYNASAQTFTFLLNPTAMLLK